MQNREDTTHPASHSEWLRFSPRDQQPPRGLPNMNLSDQQLTLAAMFCPFWNPGYFRHTSNSEPLQQDPTQHPMAWSSQLLRDQHTSQATNVNIGTRSRVVNTRYARTSWRFVRFNHMHRVSQEQEKFSCPIPNCSKQFSRSDTRIRHLQEIHGLNAKEFLCPNVGCSRAKAGAGFKRRDRHRKHVESCTTRGQFIFNTLPNNTHLNSPASTIKGKCIRISTDGRFGFQ